MSGIKEFYREVCSKDSCIPIFSQDWWLDAVCGKDKWNVVGIKNCSDYSALLPYYQTKKMIFSILKQPILTPVLSPWFHKSSEEMPLFHQLIDSLSFADSLYLHFPYSRDAIRGIEKNDCMVSERITYIIDSPDEASAWKQLEGNTRRLIQKAMQTLEVRESSDLSLFYEVLHKSFARKDMEVPYTYAQLKTLDDVCTEKGCRKILFSTDPEGNIHSTMYMVWDQTKLYYLLGGIDPDYRKSGGQSLLIWEGIKEALSTGKIFDFEGSMVPSIASFFKSFGSVPAPYAVIHKDHSFLLKLYRRIRAG